MLKQIFFVLVLVVLFNAIFVFSGGLELLVKKDAEVDVAQSISPDMVDVFQFTLEDEVRKKIGTPNEGFEPYMFLQVFSGLVETDFSEVEASIGKYVIIEGVLTYKTDSSKLIHNAAKSIGRIGMKTLLQNISNRLGIDLAGEGTITDIMRSLTSRE